MNNIFILTKIYFFLGNEYFLNYKIIHIQGNLSLLYELIAFNHLRRIASNSKNGPVLPENLINDAHIGMDFL